MKISRDARRVLDTLLEVSNKTEFTVEDAWIAERLVYDYFPNIIIGHIKRFYNPKSKNGPDTMKFYEKPARSQNHGRRETEAFPDDQDKFIIWHRLSSYVSTDYSFDHLDEIKRTILKPDDVKYGIKIGMQERVYSIPYAFRVAEKYMAERHMRQQQIQNRRELFSADDGNNDINSRGILDIASRVADWQDDLENLDLQKKAKRIYREDK